MSYWYADSAAADDTADGRASVALSFTAASIVATGTHTWQITDANEAPFGSVVVGDHICLVSAAVGTDYGWYEVTEVTSAIRLQLLYLAGTEHPEATAAYNSTSGPKKTLNAGAAASVKDVIAASDTVWLADGTYDMNYWRYLNGQHATFRALPKCTGEPIIQNTTSTSQLFYKDGTSLVSATFSFYGVTIRRGACTQSQLLYIVTNNSRIVVDDCTIDNQDYGTGVALFEADYTAANPGAIQGFSVTNCRFSNLGGVRYGFKLSGCGTCIATNNTVDSACGYVGGADAPSPFIQIGNRINRALFENNGSAASRIRNAHAKSQFLQVLATAHGGQIVCRNNFMQYASLTYPVYGKNNPETNPVVLLENNDYERLAGSEYPSVQLGMDYPSQLDVATPKTWRDYKIGKVIIRNNTLREETGAVARHVLSIGFGVVGAVIRGNRVYALASGANEFGIVCKGTGCSVEDNLVYGSRGIYVKGGQYNQVRRNSVVGTVGYAFSLGNQSPLAGGTGTCSGASAAGTTIILASETSADDLLIGYEICFTNGPAAGESRLITDWALGTTQATVDQAWVTGRVPANGNTYYLRVRPVGNVITDNIFQAETGADCLQVVDDAGAADPVAENANLIDRNLYYPNGTADLALIGASTLLYTASITDLRNLWQTVGGDWEYRLAHENDQNSQVGNPLFKNVTGDPDTDDWTLLPASPASDMGGDGQAIGAGGAMGGGGGGGFVRI